MHKDRRPGGETPKPSKPTRDRLADALAAEEDRRLIPIILRAREGYYDEFTGSLATPISQLVEDLRQAGRKDLARRAMDGEWDSTREEAEAWARSPEGKSVINELPQRMRRAMFGEGPHA